MPEDDEDEGTTLVNLENGQRIEPTLVAGVMVDSQPAIGCKGVRLYAPCGHSVIVFSASTAARMGEFTPQHKGKVTATVAGERRPGCREPIATASVLGEVRLWDGTSGSLLASLKLDGSVRALRWLAKQTLLATVEDKAGHCTVDRIAVTSKSSGSDEETTTTFSLQRQGPLPLGFAKVGQFDAAGGFAVMTDGGVNAKVYADGWRMAKTLPHRHAVTSVCIDPQGRYVATGDRYGVVLIWWGVFQDDPSANAPKMLPPARWHWHHSPVQAMIHCGPLLLTGGGEGVLCIRNAEEDTVNFIPRLGAPIRHLATSEDGGHVSISLEDNSIALVDGLFSHADPKWIHALDVPVQTQFEGRASVNFLQQASAATPSTGSTSSWHGSRTASSEKLSNGLPLPVGGSADQKPSSSSSTSCVSSASLHVLKDGTLAATCGGRRVQFLDQMGKVVAGRSVILERSSMVREGDPMKRWTLRTAVFSNRATCLLTCETRRNPALERFDVDSTFRVVLKWWRRGDKGHYGLDSIVYDPHSADLTAVLAHPEQENCFVTASLDGEFKVWESPQSGSKSRSQDPADDGSCWQCVGQGNWRNRPILSGSVSPDGAVLAFGFHGFITLWDRQSLAEMHSVPLAEETHRPLQLQTATANGQLLLLALVRGTAPKKSMEVICWDLLTLGIVARLALDSQFTGGQRCTIRIPVFADNSQALRLLAYQTNSDKLKVWRLARSSGNVMSQFELEASGTLPSGKTLLDAAFGPPTLESDEVSVNRVLCWTSSFELWSLDLPRASSSDTSKAKVVRKRRKSDKAPPEEKPKQSTIGKVLNNMLEAAGELGNGADSLIVNPALQAGVTRQLLGKVCPSHVPSHMLPTTSALFERLVGALSNRTAEAPAWEEEPKLFSADHGAAALAEEENQVRLKGPTHEAKFGLLLDEEPDFMLDYGPNPSLPQLPQQAFFDALVKGKGR